MVVRLVVVLLAWAASSQGVRAEVQCTQAAAMQVIERHRNDLQRATLALADAGCQIRAREFFVLAQAQLPPPARPRAALTMARKVAAWCETGCCGEARRWGLALVAEAEGAGLRAEDVALSLQAPSPACAATARPTPPAPEESLVPAFLTLAGTLVVGGAFIYEVLEVSEIHANSSALPEGSQRDALEDDFIRGQILANVFGGLALGGAIATVWLFVDPPLTGPQVAATTDGRSVAALMTFQF